MSEVPLTDDEEWWHGVIAMMLVVMVVIWYNDSPRFQLTCSLWFIFGAIGRALVTFLEDRKQQAKLMAKLEVYFDHHHHLNHYSSHLPHPVMPITGAG